MFWGEQTWASEPVTQAVVAMGKCWRVWWWCNTFIEKGLKTGRACGQEWVAQGEETAVGDGGTGRWCFPLP